MRGEEGGEGGGGERRDEILITVKSRECIESYILSGG